MKFSKMLNLINEFTKWGDAERSGEEIVVGRRSFRGAVNDIAVEVLRYRNDSNLPVVRIYSKDDPNKIGHVPYKTFKDAVASFDSLTSMPKVVDYIRSYVNELDSYKWLNILKDEDIEAMKAKAATEFAGMAPMGGPPPTEGGGPGLGGSPIGGEAPPVGGETPPGAEAGTPPGAEAGAPSGAEAGGAPAPEAGAAPAEAPPPEAPAPAA